MRIFHLLIAASALAATPAMAERKPDNFLTCDGYAAPTRKGDGITTGSNFFGLVSQNSDFRRADVRLGAAGAEACDQALADPLLQPQFRLRRANLEQGKAIHLLAAGKSEEALAALKASDETGAGAEDPKLFADSIGVGNRLLRAWAYIQMWKRDQARAELDAIDKIRPEAATLHDLSRDVRNQMDADLEPYLAGLRKAAPLEPRFLPVLFNLAIVYGRFDEAVALYPQIDFDLPKNHGIWRISGAETMKYELIPERARIAGAMAYALRALGRADQATALLADARGDVKATMTPPAADQDGRISKSRQLDYDNRIAAADKAMASLDGWEKAAELRREATETSLEAVAPRLKLALTGDYPVMLDVIRSGKAANAEEKAAIGRVADKIFADIDAGRRRGVQSLTLAKLVEQLPRPETPSNTPRFKSGGDGFFLSDNGFHVDKGEDGLRIRFVSATASPAMVEEAAMLAAAQQARAAGKDGFIIQSRQFAQRTMRNMMYGRVYGETPSGYEVELRILPVSARALPAELEGRSWRVIEAAPIIAELQSKYAAPAAAK